MPADARGVAYVGRAAVPLVLALWTCAMRDVCLACGKPIMTVHARGFGITLMQEWVHLSRRANRNHIAIPANHEVRVVKR